MDVATNTCSGISEDALEDPHGGKAWEPVNRTFGEGGQLEKTAAALIGDSGTLLGEAAGHIGQFASAYFVARGILGHGGLQVARRAAEGKLPRVIASSGPRCPECRIAPLETPAECVLHVRRQTQHITIRGDDMLYANVNQEARAAEFLPSQGQKDPKRHVGMAHGAWDVLSRYGVYWKSLRCDDIERCSSFRRMIGVAA